MQLKFKVGNSNNEKYKIEKILDSTIYKNETKNGHLLGFYYLVL